MPGLEYSAKLPDGQLTDDTVLAIDPNLDLPLVPFALRTLRNTPAITTVDLVGGDITLEFFNVLCRELKDYPTVKYVILRGNMDQETLITCCRQMLDLGTLKKCYLLDNLEALLSSHPDDNDDGGDDKVAKLLIN